MVTGLWKKRGAAPVVLFSDPGTGMELARRLAARFGFCSRRKGSAGNGGEKTAAAGCPGSLLTAAGITAGAGCKAFEGDGR